MQREITFDGASFDEERDGDRLRSQLNIVRRIMCDGRPHTLSELADAASCSVASASARVRDLRKDRFGGHRIDRTYAGNGVWLYRMAVLVLTDGK